MHEDAKASAKVNRLAEAEADKRGLRPPLGADMAALITAVCVFMLFDVLGWSVGAQDTYLLPVLGLTVLGQASSLQ